MGPLVFVERKVALQALKSSFPAVVVTNVDLFVFDPNSTARYLHLSPTFLQQSLRRHHPRECQEAAFRGVENLGE